MTNPFSIGERFSSVSPEHAPKPFKEIGTYWDRGRPARPRRLLARPDRLQNLSSVSPEHAPKPFKEIGTNWDRGRPARPPRFLTVRRSHRAFTLIELLIVVAIIAILAAIAIPNFLLAKQRANQSRCATNLKAVAYALYAYKLDLNRFPPADGAAGLQESMGQTCVGCGPAANGSWDGVPRALVRLNYLTTDQYLFCPTLAERFKGGRQQRFRYAYNNSAVDTGGTSGAPNNIDRDSHDIWYARCLFVPMDQSFDPAAKEVRYPHGENHDKENALMSNSRVELRDGRADYQKQFAATTP